MPLAALLGRLTGAPRWPVLPTADYYLLGGVGDLVGDGPRGSKARPIVRLGPNSWAHGDRLVLVRYATPAELALLDSRRWRTVHYVIDDLIPAAEASPELPADYRDRLGRFARETLPRILDHAVTVVAPSRAVLACFPQHAGRLLDPCCLPLVGGGRLPPPTPWRGDVRIAFLGTRSHIGSMPLLAAIAGRLARELPRARLHLFLGRHLPEGLARQPSVVNRAPIAWPQFGRFCRDNPFHVALAPVQDTPFARARSITKLMDHAAVGAVGLYSRRAPFAGVVTDGVDGRLVDDDAAAWCAAIRALADAPAMAERMAAAGARLAAERGAPSRVRAFWLEALGLAEQP